jgi:hypothetical protein
MSEHKKIAVVEISGLGGLEVADTLTQELIDSGHFDVLDRRTIRHILREHHLGKSGYLDPENSVELGRLIGSTAMIFGNVSRRDYRKIKSHRDVTCTDRKSKAKYPCRKFTITGIWDLKVTLRVVDTATGEIITMKTLTKNREKSASDYDSAPRISWNREAFFDGLVSQVVQDFMAVIAPHREYVKLQLFSDSKLPELSEGIYLAKRGNWNGAIWNFRNAVERAYNTPGITPELKARAHYNLGVSLGYSGRYNEGIMELNRAVSIFPETVFYNEISKINTFKEEEEIIRTQQSSRE